MSHYSKHNFFLSQYQHGFRRGYICETQLLATVGDIQRGIDSSTNRYDLVILDFTKVFDKVSFTRLIFKLKQSGINKFLLLWINNWLTHRTQRVVVDGCQSAEAAVTSGVPQGTVLGPLFFLVYNINDIQRNIRGSQGGLEGGSEPKLREGGWEGVRQGGRGPSEEGWREGGNRDSLGSLPRSLPPSLPPSFPSLLSIPLSLPLPPPSSLPSLPSLPLPPFPPSLPSFPLPSVPSLLIPPSPPSLSLPPSLPPHPSMQIPH